MLTDIVGWVSEVASVADTRLPDLVFVEGTVHGTRNTLSVNNDELGISAGVAGSSEVLISVTELADNLAFLIFIGIIVVDSLFA